MKLKRKLSESLSDSLRKTANIWRHTDVRGAENGMSDILTELFKEIDADLASEMAYSRKANPESILWAERVMDRLQSHVNYLNYLLEYEFIKSDKRITIVDKKLEILKAIANLELYTNYQRMYTFEEPDEFLQHIDEYRSRRKLKKLPRE